MSPIRYEISDVAYLTIVKHLSKYTHAVSGVLLGSLTPKGTVSITRALPIAHSALAIATTPMSETALHVAERRAIDLNLQLVGVYFGNDIADDASIGTFPTRLADAVRMHFSKACLLMIQASSLQADVRKSEHCFRLCVRDSEQAGTWAKDTRPKGDLQVSTNVLNIADSLFDGKGPLHDVVDFEDHCLNPASDWFNEDIEASWRALQPSAS